MEREKRVFFYYVIYIIFKLRKAVIKSFILRLLVIEKFVLRSIKECYDIVFVYLIIFELFL